EGGGWAEDAIANRKLRFGWQVVSLSDIHAENWGRIRRSIEKEHQGKKGVVTTDTERLRDLVTTGPGDLWITFHGSRLFWGRVAPGAVEQDDTSKFRRLVDGWHGANVRGEPLLVGRIPGVIAQLQGFRGTVCSVRATDVLRRLIAGETSPAHRAVSAARDSLVNELQGAIQQLHWKDFETLVDLIFRDAGWRRLGVLGESMKFADLELEEPITKDRYQVQVKSRADVSEYVAYANAFLTDQHHDFRRLYFVVHSPTPALAAHISNQERDDRGDRRVEPILPGRLAQMVVNAGLTGWVLDKVR
ncbi:MAG: hypothetical protein ACYC3Q_08200, partial [Gemmatimonadaceae bacterium]